MSEPWSEAPAAPQAVDVPPAPAAPKSLLEQMQELLASVSADLAELQSSGPRRPSASPADTATGTATDGDSTSRSR